MSIRTVALGALGASLLAGPAAAVTLVGASQFDETHAFTKTMRKFEQEVKACYDGDVDFRMHLNSELGLEKDYFENMSQGIAVDFAIVAPSHMSTFSQMAPLMDMPFLFRNLDHWRAVMEANALQPVADDILEQADVRIIGYAGGGTRNVFADHPVTTMEELEGLQMRVMGAPIQTRIFDAIRAAPTVIAYSEVYNAIQTGVISGAENEAAGIQQMKFYEVGPHVSLTKHAITVRPLAFSNKTFQRLDEGLQECITEAGRVAGAHGREIESTQDQEILDRLESEGLIEVHEFNDRAKLLELAEPVKLEYAEELGALDVYQAVVDIE
jgi:TRAP-type C4-dicarboxylate transport system substrate-binding protein